MIDLSTIKPNIQPGNSFGGAASDIEGARKLVDALNQNAGAKIPTISLPESNPTALKLAHEYLTKNGGKADTIATIEKIWVGKERYDRGFLNNLAEEISSGAKNAPKNNSRTMSIPGKVPGKIIFGDDISWADAVSLVNNYNKASGDKVVISGYARASASYLITHDLIARLYTYFYRSGKNKYIGTTIGIYTGDIAITSKLVKDMIKVLNGTDLGIVEGGQKLPSSITKNQNFVAPVPAIGSPQGSPSNSASQPQSRASAAPRAPYKTRLASDITSLAPVQSLQMALRSALPLERMNEVMADGKLGPVTLNLMSEFLSDENNIKKYGLTKEDIDLPKDILGGRRLLSNNDIGKWINILSGIDPNGHTVASKGTTAGEALNRVNSYVPPGMAGANGSAVASSAGLFN